jgi:hypothetical protein
MCIASLFNSLKVCGSVDAEENQKKALAISMALLTIYAVGVVISRCCTMPNRKANEKPIEASLEVLLNEWKNKASTGEDREAPAEKILHMHNTGATKLNLSGYKLKRLPSSDRVWHLPKLKWLDLSKNQLSDLPSAMEQLSLEYLNVSENPKLAGQGASPTGKVIRIKNGSAYFFECPSVGRS